MTNFNQFNLGGETVASFSMCARCGREIHAAQSRLSGYGPVCAGHVLGGSYLMKHNQDENIHDMRWVDSMPVTEVDMQLASISMNKVDELIDASGKTCMCGEKLEDGSLYNFDHDGGFTLPGFGARQWLFVHCHYCGYDFALWKVRELADEIRDAFKSKPCPCDDCPSAWYEDGSGPRIPLSHCLHEDECEKYQEWQ